MTKKEILIIFVLAVLVTGLSWFRVVVFERYIPAGWWIFRTSLAQPAPPYPIVQRGFPIYYWTNWPKQTGSLQYGFLTIDLLFWFLIIFAIWRVIKLVKEKRV